MLSTVELTGLELPVDLGTYAQGDVVPDAHYLDLTLAIDPSAVLIAKDDMALVFDYDPLVGEIVALARDGHYETQEWLMTRIVRACAQYGEISGVELMVYKTPVLAGTGRLGVRLCIDRADLEQLRANASSN
ncbi:dihydroneopterin aldolase [Blastomonas sp. AAP53]|uniref:dihydroneopterin aldolase n=1 Tax=Blastomonas sp. AAP53 TaxID=1248760 RepID=UPI00035FEA15|nr:dihydroneopterin aldolase [Blastomonas sp. AAP53]